MEFAKKAKAVNADIILFTEAETSPIGDLSTLVYRMQADADRLPDSLGWYSEYAINLCYECIVMYLMKKRGLSKEKMEKRTGQSVLREGANHGKEIALDVADACEG